jgi:hypothetical protein
MSELAGLIGFDLTLLAVGIAVSLAVDPASSVAQALRSCGLTLWLGVAPVGVVLTWLVAVGVDPLVPIVLAVEAVSIGTALGVRKARARRQAILESPPLSIGAAFGYGLVALVAVGQLLASWNHPVTGIDGWAMWLPKARTLAHGLHVSVAGMTSFSGTTYPPLVPVLQASTFGFMGAADEVMLTVQAAVFFVAFVHAAVVVGRRLAPDLYVVPFALLLVSIPEVLTRELQPDADYPTAFLFVLAVLLCLAYLRAGRTSDVLAAGLILSACVNARREGLLYAAAIGAGALVLLALRERKTLLVAAASIVAGLTYAPWFFWVRVHHVVADAVPPPSLTGGTAGTSEGGSVLHALHVFGSYLFNAELWGIAPYIGFVALGAAVLGGRRSREPVLFVCTVLVVAGLGLLWRLMWYGGADNPAGTPIPRLVGAWSLLLCASAPILLSAAAGDAARDFVPRVLRPLGAVRPWSAAIVAAGPLVLLAVVIPRLGSPTAGCEAVASSGSPAVLVFGHPKRYSDAQALQRQVREAGFPGGTISFDHCGRLRVQSGAVDSLAAARMLRARAAAGRLDARIQRL